MDWTVGKMDAFIIKGKSSLSGEVDIHGAKNSALPILAATLLSGGVCVLENCPELSDVENAIEILKSLGCKVRREADRVIVDSESVSTCRVEPELMHKIRSSIVFMGALIGRTGCAHLSFPGGCELGPRPIDIHINSLKRLGVVIDEKHGHFSCTTPNGVNGVTLNLPFPSVGATENIIMAAVTSQGTTKIHNAAREPEIVDLANFLNRCGANIYGAGEGVITIDGVHQLHGCTHRIIPDRIEAATYMAAAAVTGSTITLNNVISDHIEPVYYVFREAGCSIRTYKNKLLIQSPERLKRVKLIRTLVYPGFPTDAQAPVMAMLTVANGTSMFIETIFQNRYKHVDELIKMGANIKTEERVAVVEGVKSLYGAKVAATDLRSGAALVIAGLAAKGETTVTNVYHIDRGYEQLTENLRKLGADIYRTTIGE